MAASRSRARHLFARTALAVSVCLVASHTIAHGQALEPIVYTVHILAPATQYAEVEAIVPTDGAQVVEMMMPIWSPGYYRVEDYASKVEALNARTSDGTGRSVTQLRKNRWSITTGGMSHVVLTYRVLCAQRSVTTNWIGADYAVLNGAPTFITLAEQRHRPHDVRLTLPSGWTHAMTGLDDVPGAPHHFRAADYEALVDSPMLAGKLVTHEFVVAGKTHVVVGAGDYASWDGASATRDLNAIVEATYRLWGFLPYDKYLFLLMFRPGRGGLEHRNSTLSTVRPDTSKTSRQWSALGLLSHEHFHSFNVKRLRPVELGPFDFETPPTTGSLWISEGVTSYYSDLMMARAGLQTSDEYLASVSAHVAALQNSPGRLKQSVDQSSRDVWNNSNSGINPSVDTVSYYNKGQVLGLLLDARIRRATNGRRSLDDVMRLAYQRFAGERGFTEAEFRAAAERIAGVDLKEWWRRSVFSTEELDYSDLLVYYGLEYVASSGPSGSWTLRPRVDATNTQAARLRAWLAPARSNQRR